MAIAPLGKRLEGTLQRRSIETMMDCSEYWQSQGIDLLDAMFTVGCPNAAGELATHQAMGVLIVILQVFATFCFFKARS